MQKSFTAAMLAEFEKQSADAYGVRQELVDKFRFLIDTGRYHVSAADVAQAMMDDGLVTDDFVVEDL
jgi:anti-sigma28 factor (negative regulator of flagellin synthesis)